MKRTLKHTLITSTIISIGILLCNIICAIFFKTIPFGKQIMGGEIIGKRGLGLIVYKIVPLTTIENSSSSFIVKFDILSFITTFIIIFIIILLIIVIKNMIKKTRNN